MKEMCCKIEVKLIVQKKKKNFIIKLTSFLNHKIDGGQGKSVN